MNWPKKSPVKIEKRIKDWKNKSIITPSGCWRYPHSLNREGRPLVGFNGRVMYMSRVSAHIFLGLDISDRKQQGLHKTTCPNLDCWNPDHLYIGTQGDNMRDRSKVRIRELDRHGLKGN